LRKEGESRELQNVLQTECASMTDRFSSKNQKKRARPTDESKVAEETDQGGGEGTAKGEGSRRTWTSLGLPSLGRPRGEKGGRNVLKKALDGRGEREN